MTHWLLAPVVLPAMLAPFIVLAARFHIGIQRVFSIVGILTLIAISLGLVWETSDGTIMLYQLGAWAAPFGIVLVGDQLSTMMVLLTSVLALCVLVYAISSGWDDRGWHFHALFQFQLMGILGAFLTGDLFNLFVFFEVLLIASYGLMIHAGGTKRLRAGVQYVLFNLIGSTLFLFALGAIYAETGTLNMADLADRMSLFDGSETVGIRIAAVLLLLVFAIKAAIAPLHFWLPASYSEAPAPVAALFAIMTKVGAYAIIRVYTIAFPPDVEVTAGVHGLWLLPAALVTMVIGAVGVLAAKKLDRLKDKPGDKIVVTEGIYSMLGDSAPLKEMVAVKKEYGAYLMGDEAHSLDSPCFQQEPTLLLRKGRFDEEIGESLSCIVQRTVRSFQSHCIVGSRIEEAPYLFGRRGDFASFLIIQFLSDLCHCHLDRWKQFFTLQFCFGPDPLVHVVKSVVD